MQSDRRGDVHVADTVAVGHAKRLVVRDIGERAFDSPAGHRVVAGIDERDRPGLGHAAMEGHFLIPHVKRHIRRVQRIFLEVLLDDVSLVPEADHEIVDSVRRVNFHDVPKNRPPADLHHRLGSDFRFLGKACSKPSRKNDRLHARSLSNLTPVSRPIFAFSP